MSLVDNPLGNLGLVYLAGGALCSLAWLILGWSEFRHFVHTHGWRKGGIQSCRCLAKIFVIWPAAVGVAVLFALTMDRRRK